MNLSSARRPRICHRSCSMAQTVQVSASKWEAASGGFFSCTTWTRRCSHAISILSRALPPKSTGTQGRSACNANTAVESLPHTRDARAAEGLLNLCMHRTPRHICPRSGGRPRPGFLSKETQDVTSSSLAEPRSAAAMLNPMLLYICYTIPCCSELSCTARFFTHGSMFVSTCGHGGFR